jgi:predicted transcriptional regulator
MSKTKDIRIDVDLIFTKLPKKYKVFAYKVRNLGSKNLEKHDKLLMQNDLKNLEITNVELKALEICLKKTSKLSKKQIAKILNISEFAYLRYFLKKQNTKITKLKKNKDQSKKINRNDEVNNFNIVVEKMERNTNEIKLLKTRVDLLEENYQELHKKFLYLQRFLGILLVKNHSVFC